MNILIVIVVAFTVLILAAGLLWTIALAGGENVSFLKLQSSIIKHHSINSIL